MAATRVVDTRFYQVAAHTPVALAVTIGDGQSGGASTLFSGTVVPQPSRTPVTFGAPGQTLAQTSLSCTVDVAVTNPATTMTSVVCQLTGGLQNQTHTFVSKAAAQGDTVEYILTFALIL